MGHSLKFTSPKFDWWISFPLRAMACQTLDMGKYTDPAEVSDFEGIGLGLEGGVKKL